MTRTSTGAQLSLMDQQAAHHVGPTLTIDLGAICRNYRRLAELAPSAEVAAVVKADAYGLGAQEIAPSLAHSGCKTFFVALLNEAITLRRFLPTQEIAVLAGPHSACLASFRDHRLTPVLNSLAQLATWQSLAADAPPAMLHIDTGMNRLGLTLDDVEELGRTPGLLDGIEISTIVSHLACADNQAAPLNETQRSAFDTARGQLAHLLPNAQASLANSSGIFLGPAYHHDLVRPGAALFGLNPLMESPNPMEQVIELTATILQIRNIDRPMTVGYGATHRAGRGAKIATVAAGYADGYLRSLGNCGHVFVADTVVPVVGRVSMDLVTIDVTGLPEDRTRPGTIVELIGPNMRTDDVAAAAGTIGYELLTRLQPRGARHYRGGTG